MAYYDNVLSICEKYMSGGGKKFLDRQIKSHLKKDPEAVASADKTDLAKWCRVSGALLVGEDKAKQLESDILAA